MGISKKKFNAEVADTTQSFINVKKEMDLAFELIGDLQKSVRDYASIAKNAQSRADIAIKENESLREYVYERFGQLDNNGVATAINKLNDEVFKERKEKKNALRVNFDYLFGIATTTPKPVEEVTLAGKVEAIAEHLKLNFEVAPEEVKAAKPVAKKVVTKKKGRR